MRRHGIGADWTREEHVTDQRNRLRSIAGSRSGSSCPRRLLVARGAYRDEV